MNIGRLLEIGLSGWICVLIPILLGGYVVVRKRIKRRTLQLNIRADGDVAGGNITKGRSNKQKCQEHFTKEKYDTIQKNVTAKGDVAGGSITKESN